MGEKGGGGSGGCCHIRFLWGRGGPTACSSRKLELVTQRRNGYELLLSLKDKIELRSEADVTWSG